MRNIRMQMGRIALASVMMTAGSALAQNAAISPIATLDLRHFPMNGGFGPHIALAESGSLCILAGSDRGNGKFWLAAADMGAPGSPQWRFELSLSLPDHLPESVVTSANGDVAVVLFAQKNGFASSHPPGDEPYLLTATGLATSTRPDFTWSRPCAFGDWGGAFGRRIDISSDGQLLFLGVPFGRSMTSGELVGKLSASRLRNGAWVEFASVEEAFSDGEFGGSIAVVGAVPAGVVAVMAEGPGRGRGTIHYYGVQPRDVGSTAELTRLGIATVHDGTPDMVGVRGGVRMIRILERAPPGLPLGWGTIRSEFVDYKPSEQGDRSVLYVHGPYGTLFDCLRFNRSNSDFLVTSGQATTADSNLGELVARTSVYSGNHGRWVVSDLLTPSPGRVVRGALSSTNVALVVGESDGRGPQLLFYSLKASGE